MNTDRTELLWFLLIDVTVVLLIWAMLSDSSRNYDNPNAYEGYGESHLATKIGELHQELYILETAVAKQGKSQ